MSAISSTLQLVVFIVFSALYRQPMITRLCGFL